MDEKILRFIVCDASTHTKGEICRMLREKESTKALKIAREKKSSPVYVLAH
jgi:hypothetical protein